eukprot:1388779-Amorphochlora_amoeboformis.AAC.2
MPQISPPSRLTLGQALAVGFELGLQVSGLPTLLELGLTRPRFARVHGIVRVARGEEKLTGLGSDLESLSPETGVCGVSSDFFPSFDSSAIPEAWIS